MRVALWTFFFVALALWLVSEIAIIVTTGHL